MSIKLVARRFEDFEGFVLLKPCSSANPSQLGWLDLNWRQILVQNIPKPSPVAYPCTLLISPVFVGFCCAILGWVFQRLHSMLEWEDLQIGILWPATYIIYIFLMEAWPCQPNIPPPWTSSVWLDRPCTERCALARLDVRLTLNCGASQTSLVAVMFYLQAYLSHLLLT